MELRKIDTSSLERALRTGQKTDCRKALRALLEGLGYDGLESPMLRSYVVTDVFLCASSFASAIGVPDDELRRSFDVSEERLARLRTSAEAVEALNGLLEQCVEWRVKLCGSDRTAVIDKAKAFIQRSYNVEGVSLCTVSREVSLSPTYFSMLFKKQTGTTFVDYLNGVRIERAKELLCCTLMQVSEIAYAVGFKDYRYFSHVFRRRVGLSPREYQRQSNAISS